jgi:hypothetical protein
MDVLQSHITNIQQKFAYLESRIKTAGSLNLPDIHVIAEIFYMELFNILGVFGKSFKKADDGNPRAPYIDLIDDESKIAIQVTAQNDSEKITRTIQGFFANPDHSSYNLKVLLIGKVAKDYRKDFTKIGRYNFDVAKDVIDIPKLIELIMRDSGILTKINTFLDEQILLPRPQTELNEVETIMGLLAYLSDDANYKEFDGQYVCDPEQKINNRFKEYADRFKEEFANLLATYCTPFAESKKTFGLDSVRAEKVSNFLKYISNRYLRESDENPVVALDKLTDFFEKKLNANGRRADHGAIRYYLLVELIGCNIFSSAIG